MRRKRAPLADTVRAIALSCVAVGLLAVIPPAAGATTVTPTSLDFGSQRVGTTSPTQSVTLTVPCSTPLVASTCTTSVVDTYVVGLATTGDFGGTTNCPAELTPVTTDFVSCIVNIFFHPTGTGTRTGVLSTGNAVTSMNPGPTVPLVGIGATTKPNSTGAGARRKCRRHKKNQHNALAAKKRKCKKRR
jgi:hypothetical protein